jgi:hypothetical protein
VCDRVDPLALSVPPPPPRPARPQKERLRSGLIAWHLESAGALEPLSRPLATISNSQGCSADGLPMMIRLRLDAKGGRLAALRAHGLDAALALPPALLGALAAMPEHKRPPALHTACWEAVRPLALETFACELGPPEAARCAFGGVAGELRELRLALCGLVCGDFGSAPQAWFPADGRVRFQRRGGGAAAAFAVEVRDQGAAAPAAPVEATAAQVWSLVDCLDALAQVVALEALAEPLQGLPPVPWWGGRAAGALRVRRVGSVAAGGRGAGCMGRCVCCRSGRALTAVCCCAGRGAGTPAATRCRHTALTSPAVRLGPATHCPCNSIAISDPVNSLSSAWLIKTLAAE